MISRRLLLAAPMLGLAVPAQAANPIKIALIQDKTGPLEAYAKQMIVGFNLGIEYATKGTGAVAGRKLEIKEKDSQFKPDLGRSLLAESFGDDDADIAVGGSGSAVALAMLPVAQEYKKVLIVCPAVADSITGDKWNRYIFRTSRNSTHDAISNALAIGKPGTVIATLGQDYAFGRDGVAAFKVALAATGAKVVHEEYAPPATTDFTAPAQRIFDALAKEPGRKVIWVIWAGADPMTKLKALGPERLGIELSTGGNILPVMETYKPLAGMEGGMNYYYGAIHNSVNDWLVAEHTKRQGGPPDFFTADGMAAAIAVVTALEKTGGVTDTEKLIAAMEGMEWQAPKGRMLFRKEDHQALQSMFGFKLKDDPAVKWAVPELTREFKIEDMNLPIANKR